MGINWNEPVFGEEEKILVKKVLDSGYVNEGLFTKELEEKLKKYLNVKHVVLTTSCTAGLFLAIKADQMIRGLKDYEVLVPDLTFIATANAVKWAGAKPILTDIERESFGISPEEIKRKITPKTKAIILMHYLARKGEIDELNKIAKENNLIIIEDAAACLGSKTNEKNLGCFGKVGCYSLQANKIISCGQGGIVVTNDDEYFEMIKRIKDQGRFNRHEELHLTEGCNLKFNDILAAIALAQFNNIEERKDNLINQKLRYEKRLLGIKEIQFPLANHEEGEFSAYVDILVENRCGLKQYLESKEIFPRACWNPLHKNPPYQNQGNDNDFPNSCFVSNNSLWLPNGPAVSLEQVDHVCEIIKEFYRKINP